MMYNISNSKSTTVQRLGFNFVASSEVVEESEAYPRNHLRQEVLDFRGKFEIYKVEQHSDDPATDEGAKGTVKLLSIAY